MTAGAGHRRAAEALAQAARQAFPQAEVDCRDLLEDVPAWLRRGYPFTYYLLVRWFPLLWGACYAAFDQALCYRLIQPLRRTWNLAVTRRFARRLRQSPPDLVIATHFFPADVVAACKGSGRIRCPLLVVVTDLHPHRFWLSPHADRYVYATVEGARTAERRGIPPERLRVIGIPISGRFHGPFDRRAILDRFGLETDREVILVMSGGTTVGPFERVVESLIALEGTLPRRAQLLVICGEDAAAVQRLTQRGARAAMPIRVFGFIEAMPEAMAASRLAVAKAGGLTVAEALAMGLPLVIYHAIPGQERVNARYVAQHGAAVLVRRPEEAGSVVRRFLEDRGFAETMRKAAGALSRPRAAEEIIEQVVKPLLRSTIESPRSAETSS